MEAALDTGAAEPKARNRKPPPAIEPLLVSDKQGGDALSISKAKFRQLAQQGHFERVQIGRSVKYTWASVKRFVERGTAAS